MTTLIPLHGPDRTRVSDKVRGLLVGSGRARVVPLRHTPTDPCATKMTKHRKFSQLIAEG